MAAHDRLKPPTMEAAPTRAFFGLPLTLALAVLAAGFAYAMPHLKTVSADSQDANLVVEATPTGSTHTTTASPTPGSDDANEDTEQDTDEDGPGKPDNHGKVVSTAAHCDVKGRAHGELVRSIAKDKAATVADAQAACDAAMAAQASASSDSKATGKGRAPKPPKPVKPAKAPKPTAPAASDSSVETDDDASRGGGKPDHVGKPAKP